MKEGTKNVNIPLQERSNVSKLLNRSKLVEGWLLCNQSKKLEFNVQHEIILMNLNVSTRRQFIKRYWKMKRAE